MPKRRNSEYAKAVAEAEREAKFFRATQPAYVPDYRVGLARDISELSIAWRDMTQEQKQALIAETIRKGKSFARRIVARPDKAPGRTIHISPAERNRQLDAAYRAMTPEQRAAYDHRKGRMPT